ncbi:SUKH-3 domain-containing protein [Streptomyces sp. ADMS]|uniref:SUKH-3 domain-containing protein n=1 Tax=Streptomyces sp. ADMS TaxID=3071415 RepID=UPI00296F6DCE|nr:SUKH-3 domain-containing protein [Streptomyces sp. ADMS]MDW4911143.1 SUKH-3 domain-containing protein [Streptomyces sp. ADMS]
MTDEIPSEWSALTHRVLRSAAWYPGRSVPIEKWENLLRDYGGFRIHEAARRFLAEFGGLATDEWTPGPIMPQSPFRFDPFSGEANGTALAELGDTFTGFSKQAGTHLYPIGRADSGDSYLGMAVDGAVYIGQESTELLADTAYEALENLVMERNTGAPLPFVLTGDHLELPPEAERELRPDGVPRWSAEADRVLRLAGWHPSRSVPTGGWEGILHEADEGFVIHEAARRFLSEFGGLEIDQRGPGRTMARSPFRLDPSLAKWDYEIFEVLSDEAEADLYPIGDLGQGNLYLGMSQSGAVYMGMDSVELLADTADGALDKLIQGIR